MTRAVTCQRCGLRPRYGRSSTHCLPCKMEYQRERRGHGNRGVCACGNKTNGGTTTCGYCRQAAKRVYNTPVPRKVRRDVSHGYGKRLGRPAGDEYSNIAAMPPSDEVCCPKCGEKMERRQLNRHWREMHR